MNDRSARVHLVDVLRLVALLQMVNGHTLDAILLPEVREASWFFGARENRSAFALEK